MKRVYLLAGVVALLAAGESQACWRWKCRPVRVCQTAPAVVPASYSQPVPQAVPVAAQNCPSGQCPAQRPSVASQWRWRAF